MPKIRIYDPKSGFRLWLPVPYKIFINVFLRRSIVLNIINGNIKDLIEKAADCPVTEPLKKEKLVEQIRHWHTIYDVADAFDYGKLRYALTNIVDYRGLVLVDVEAADGTIVKITL